MKTSVIGTAESTWNPIRGCRPVSRGCDNCWAARIAGRYAKKDDTYHGIARLNKKLEPVWTGKVELVTDKLYDPLLWLEKKPRQNSAGRLIQVCTMSDLFYDKIPRDWRDVVFGVMALCGDHQFQVLTKRPQAMHDYFVCPGVWGRIEHWARKIWLEVKGQEYPSGGHLQGPLAHTWLGVSVEDQATADERCSVLQTIPAALRYVACEPILDEISLTKFLEGDNRMEWVIAGGESGMDGRACDPQWVRKLRDECLNAKVPFYFHQWGAWLPSTTGGLRAHLDPGSTIYLWPSGEMSVNLAKSDIRSMQNWGTTVDGTAWQEFPILEVHRV